MHNLILFISPWQLFPYQKENQDDQHKHSVRRKHNHNWGSHVFSISEIHDGRALSTTWQGGHLLLNIHPWPWSTSNCNQNCIAKYSSLKFKEVWDMENVSKDANHKKAQLMCHHDVHINRWITQACAKNLYDDNKLTRISRGLSINWCTS